MKVEELAANAKAVISVVTGYFAKLQNPVLSINVQATDTMALPVWRRPDASDPINLRKHGTSEGESSAASDTGSSYAHSDTDRSALSAVSEASAMSEASGAEQSGASEASDSDEDVDDKPTPKKESLPLVNGLKKKRKLGEAAKGAAMKKQ